MLSPYLMKALPQYYPQEAAGQQDPSMMVDPRAQEMAMYNPLNPYNPMHMARLMQMQNQQLATEKLQTLVEESPKLEDLLNKRMEFAVNLSTQQLKDSEQPLTILALGPVETEKVRFMNNLMFNLEKEGKMTKSFKVVGEDYNPEEEENTGVENKNFFLAEPIKHISELVENIQNADFEVIFVKDIGSLGTKDEIQNFLKIAKEKKISVIGSTTINKLDGSIPDQLPTLVDNSVFAFQFEGVDILDDKQLATNNYVGVPITLDGEVIDTKNETYYSGMPKYERDLIVKKFLALPQSKQLITKRRLPDAKGDVSVVDVIMLPMSKLDLNESCNPNNIIPVSQATSDKLYKLSQADPPIRMTAFSPRILNWQDMGM
jgi:hypothetical protein